MDHLYLHPGNLRCAVWHRRLLLAGPRSQWFTFQLMGRNALKLTVCLLHKPYLITGLVQQGPGCHPQASRSDYSSCWGPSAGSQNHLCLDSLWGDILAAASFSMQHLLSCLCSQDRLKHKRFLSFACS